MSTPPAMSPNPETRASLEGYLGSWRGRIQEHWGIQPPSPELRWDLRGRCAGQCVGDRLIRLNRRLPELGPRAQLETLAHEYAHAVVHHLLRHGPLPAIPGGARRDWLRPHGRLWQMVMQQLGQVPRRTHDLDLPAARQSRRYSYHCGCREHQLGPVRHRRVQLGEAEYRCRACGAALRVAATAGDITPGAGSR